MLGPQVGIVVKDKHDISYYRDLFEYFNEKLDSLMSLYNINTPDFIDIIFKEITLDNQIKLGGISNIELPKRLIKISKTNNYFNNNILPLTLDDSEFGSLLQDYIKTEYLNNLIIKLNNNNILISKDSKKETDILDSFKKLIQKEEDFSKNIKFILNKDNIDVLLKDEKLQIAFLKEVIDSNQFKVFLSKNRKYIIISFYNKKFEYIRIVFQIKTGKLIFSSKDILNNENLNILRKDKNMHFLRKIGNISVCLNKDNDIELFIKNIDLQPIKYNEHKKYIVENFKKTKDSKPILIRNHKFGVFDIETFNDISSDGLTYSRVYALGFCPYNEEPSMYYLTDYFDTSPESSNKLVLKCIDEMLKLELNQFTFYVHNFGKFDAIFIYKILLEFNLTAETENQYKLIPLYRDNKMIRLQIIKNVNNKNIKINFVDSLNILNNSLDKLCKDYGVSTTKGIFPYSFVNKNNLNYIGPKPNISYYNNKFNSELHIESIVNVPKWSLRIESLKYLERDLLSLLEILEKVQKILWEDHNIELTEGLTISSLAKTKFMKYYLKDSKIPLINTNNLFQFVYSSYYGGITEVYKPHGKNLIYIDVNSLYPFAALNDMPSLICKWLESYNSEGLDLDKLFGVFYAKVITNDGYLGLLPVRTKSGLIFPNGKFDGIWTSVELKFAQDNGYQITVIKGLQFNKQESPFLEYVEELSKQKDSLKGSQRQVVKSLLNNLIGRFGLNFVKPITKTVKSSKLDYILATKEIKTFKEINKDNFLITYNPIVNKEICESHNLDYHKVLLNEYNNRNNSNEAVFQDVSIVISSFVTAYARIHMHKVKLSILKAGGAIFYSDTDSIVTDLTLDFLKELLPNYIGNKLGQLKLEHLLNEAYFISNKTYILLTPNGEEFVKAKGITSQNLSVSNFETMYLKSKSIQGEKRTSNINYNKGSVTLNIKNITIDWNSFKKRTKIYDSKTKLWVDTKPLYLDTLTKSITIYKKLFIIKYNNN